MRLKKIFSLGLLIVCTFSLFAKDYTSDAIEAFKRNDYNEVEKILSKWEKEEPSSPDMFIAYFNYYVNRELKFIPTLGKMDNGQYGLYDAKNFKDEDVKTGISYLDKALKLYPDRLDIYFGKCSCLLQAGFYEEGSKAIIAVLEASKSLDNSWKWAHDEPIKKEDGETALFSGINDYCAMLFNRFDITEPYMKSVIEKIEKLYPNNNIGLNHAANYYVQTGNNKKAISLLTKASKLDKNDFVVLGNLGYLYELENNYKKARKCYEAMIKMDNPKAKQYGQQYLDAIKDKK